MNAESSVVSVDFTLADYEELHSLLCTCADVLSDYHDPATELFDLAGDFRYFSELLESNRR